MDSETHTHPSGKNLFLISETETEFLKLPQFYCHCESATVRPTLPSLRQLPHTVRGIWAPRSTDVIFFSFQLSKLQEKCVYMEKEAIC